MKEDSEEDDDDEELKRQLAKANSDIKQMQGMFNESALAINKLQEAFQQVTQQAAKLESENQTLRAAANIVTTPLHGGRQKLKLSVPVTYDGTPGTLKGFLIQVKNYQNFHHGDFTNETEKVVHAATYLRGKALRWFEPIQEEYLKYETLDECTTETRDIYANFQGFEDALRSLFQDLDEKRQAERDLSQLRQTKSAKDYSANFRQLSVQLDLTEETKIFMFYQGLKDEVKDEIIKYAELVIKIDNRLFERRKERGDRRQGPNSGRRYQWQPQHKFNNQRNDNGPRNNGNNIRQSTSHGQHSGPMDLSAAAKSNDKKPWNPKCYNCNQHGHIAKDCKQPKKLSWKPVPERTKQVSMATKTPHVSLSWTGCYNDECFTHRSDKEATGHWPSSPDCGRTGYDMTTPEIKTKTLAMASRANSKLVRKTTEQLDELLRVQQLEPISTPAPRVTNPRGNPTRIEQLNQELEEQVKEESDEEPEHQHDPLTEQQLLSLTSNWTFNEGEKIAYGFTPSVDDTSSEEESDDEEETRRLVRYQTVDTNRDDQQRHFYSVPANQRDRGYTPKLHTEDHPTLRSDHRNHRTLFWPQCFFDKCKEHLGDKHEYQFYPRRHNEHPIRNIYAISTMIGWTMITFNNNLATFGPSPQYPMRCQHDDTMKWEECRKDECLLHATQKAKAFRLLQKGSSPPKLRFQENRLTKARREGKHITYPGQPEQSKN
ncbi:reverse transcriptase domain protein [Colletotrichum kahawae]|uniref:Reverse transcriptase domain protein n=1 Tax=Colletotrichum kahawae TaxID=34407 RepID=A0AAD9YHG1_COLKA|nr:reverse transcriptase domain protein [Colletotrichum kahawae]